MNTVASLRGQVAKILESKNHNKVPATIENLMVQHAGAVALGKHDKAAKYFAACLKFANSLKAREIKPGIELVGSDEIPTDILKNRALSHAKRVRELAILRERVNAKAAEVEESLSRIPDTQMTQFKEFLAIVQNAANLEVEAESA